MSYGGSEINPLRNRGDVQVRQLRAVGWHVRLFFLLDELHEQAHLRLARLGDDASLASLEQSFARREIKFPFGLFAAVTLHAAADEDLLDLFLEEFETGRSLLRMSRIDRLFEVSGWNERDCRTKQNRGSEPDKAGHR